MPATNIVFMCRLSVSCLCHSAPHPLTSRMLQSVPFVFMCKIYSSIDRLAPLLWTSWDICWMKWCSVEGQTICDYVLKALVPGLSTGRVRFVMPICVHGCLNVSWTSSMILYSSVFHSLGGALLYTLTPSHISPLLPATSSGM